MMLTKRTHSFATAFILAVVASWPLSARAADPLVASPNGKWAREDAAHLLRRAGFGGTPEQIDYLTRLGRDAAVDQLADIERAPRNDDPYPTETFTDRPPMGTFAKIEQEDRQVLLGALRMMGQKHMQCIQDWWLQRMVVTNRPLEEKMTLFLHGLLTSGFREVKNPRYMYEQNELLREYALGNFKELIHAISRDPAMLTYLDNGRNVKASPNENYARELLELFTLGEGNYNETDVKEAARAFTGWTAGPMGRMMYAGGGEESGGFHVRERLHDHGEKVFLGKKGNFDGDDIIHIIFEQRAASRHLAGKLWSFFVNPEPDDRSINALALEIRRHDFDLCETMRTLLRSDVFYAEPNRFALIKSPSELMVGTARMLDHPAGDLRKANQAMREMGQELFQPPNVKGWDGGRAWISTSTLYVRYNAMAGVLFGTTGRGAKQDTLDRRQAWMLASLGIATEDVEARFGPPPRELTQAVQMRGAMQNMDELESDPEMRMDNLPVPPGKASRRPEKSAATPSPVKPQAKEGDRRARLVEVVNKLPDDARTWLEDVRLPPQFSTEQPSYDPGEVIRVHRLHEPERIVDHYIQRLLQADLPRERRRELLRVLEVDESVFDADAPETAQRIREMLQLLMSMPEYQLN